MHLDYKDFRASRDEKREKLFDSWRPSLHLNDNSEVIFPKIETSPMVKAVEKRSVKTVMIMPDDKIINIKSDSREILQTLPKKKLKS